MVLVLKSEMVVLTFVEAVPVRAPVLIVTWVIRPAFRPDGGLWLKWIAAAAVPAICCRMKLSIQHALPGQADSTALTFWAMSWRPVSQLSQLNRSRSP